MHALPRVSCDRPAVPETTEDTTEPSTGASALSVRLLLVHGAHLPQHSVAPAVAAELFARGLGQPLDAVVELFRAIDQSQDTEERAPEDAQTAPESLADGDVTERHPHEPAAVAGAAV